MVDPHSLEDRERRRKEYGDRKPSAEGRGGKRRRVVEADREGRETIREENHADDDLAPSCDLLLRWRESAPTPSHWVRRVHCESKEDKRLVVAVVLRCESEVKEVKHDRRGPKRRGW